MHVSLVYLGIQIHPCTSKAESGCGALIGWAESRTWNQEAKASPTLIGRWQISPKKSRRATKEKGEWILGIENQQNSYGHVVEERREAGQTLYQPFLPPGPSILTTSHPPRQSYKAEPIPPGAERSASAALALPFPYTYLTSWTQEFNLACLPLPTDLRIQPEPVRHTSCSSPRVRSSAIEPLPGERGVLISITSSPKAPTAVFPARKERDQIKQQDELRVQKSAAWDSESKVLLGFGGRKEVSSKIFQNPDSREATHNLKVRPQTAGGLEPQKTLGYPWPPPALTPSRPGRPLYERQPL
ncbi:uncharacterized protein LOC102899379 [Felis catus]|uniref:uncharacterized protein LOC102899379 n=1 Tax=Felis catus TaxID=9685 RepID=UPI001D1A1B1D|nr:uncharacterized protein LOC102899379 [Felis catus]